MNVTTERAFWEFLWHMSLVFMVGAALASPFWFTLGYLFGKRKGLKEQKPVPEKPGQVFGHSDAEEAAIEAARRSGYTAGSFTLREDEE